MRNQGTAAKEVYQQIGIEREESFVSKLYTVLWTFNAVSMSTCERNFFKKCLPPILQLFFAQHGSWALLRATHGQ